MELVCLATADDRVAGVVSALEAHDRVRSLGEQIGDLPLSFVAPLGAYDDDSGHEGASVGGYAVVDTGVRAWSGTTLI